MAASGYTPISLYYSTTASAVPTSGNLANGELGLNIADMKLYAKNSSGVVTLLASNAATSGVSSFQTSLSGLTPSTSTTGAVTLAGTLNVANGGTGLTTLTANRIPYGAGTSAFANSANLTFDGNILLVSSTGGATQINLSDGTSHVGINATPATGGGFYFTNNRVGSTTFFRTSNASGADTIPMAFSASGNVGIGTSSPSFKLDVNGITRVIGGSASSATFNANQYIRLDTNANGGYTIGAPSSGSIATGYYFTSGTVSYAGGIEYENTGNALSLRTNNTNKFVIGSAGQFGIGATPSYGTSGQVFTSGGSGAAPTWATPTTGTVTSITVSAGTGMSGGGTVTTSGTVTLTNAGVTSVTAGTGISVSASTGGVTITSTVAGGSQAFVAFGSTGGF
jgi:hypothetical protein